MDNDVRAAEISRKTSETEIVLNLDLDGTGDSQIDIEVPFLSHMLILLASQSLCDLRIRARGDIQIDDHHTVEDIGICLGQAIKECLGEKRGINRYGSALIPMDEALARVAIDLSGRPYLDFNAIMPMETIGSFSTDLVEEFFRAMANHAGMTLHIDLLKGNNTHHIIEAIFKSFARALSEAIAVEPRIQGVWSSKGRL
ncbi:MAG: imidazoleglycerol-phosphate dehydratase HisB [Syntrophomonadaceae bacterium]|nr:imidazoleglycerol-phosphate dehydratase HisB [Syntrophomonadaceae bacterium]